MLAKPVSVRACPIEETCSNLTGVGLSKNGVALVKPTQTMCMTLPNYQQRFDPLHAPQYESIFTQVMLTRCIYCETSFIGEIHFYNGRAYGEGHSHLCLLGSIRIREFGSAR